MNMRMILMIAALMLKSDSWQPKALAQCEATEHAKLLASDGTDRDYFGGSIALSGNRAIVGDYKARPAAGGSGNRGGQTAYVFRFDGDGWKEEGRLVAVDLQPEDLFGHSVAISGDVALVGGTTQGDAFWFGAVYVYRFDGQNWVEEDMLVAPDTPPIFGFGSDVAFIGSRVLVGSPGTNTVYVFRYIDGEWTEDARLMPSDGGVGDSFGVVLAVSGDHTVVVGAPGDDDNGDDSGAGYIFQFDGTSWTEEAKLKASDGESFAKLGRAVSLSGDTALLDTRGFEENGHYRLAAYVFRRDNGTWREEATLTSVDNVGIYGYSRSTVAIFGNVALVSARRDGQNEDPMGVGFLFGFDGTEWIERARLTAAEMAWSGYFGASVALLDDVAMIGAPLDSDSGQWGGAVYAFRGLSDCNENSTIDICEIMAGGVSDCNANGKPDSCDIADAAGGDCQPDGVPDECQLGRYAHSSGRKATTSSHVEFTIPSPPPARGIVSLRFTIGRFPDAELPGIYPMLNGMWFAPAFVGPSYDELSVATTDTVFMDAEVFNAAVGGGDAVITVDRAYVRHIMLEVEYDALGLGADCNGNRIPDACDVANGTSDDCQTDGIPDECNTFVSRSPQFSPLIHPVVQRHAIAAPPRAAGEVSLFFEACCLGYDYESIDVDINGTLVGRVYEEREEWGTPQLDVLAVSAGLYNAAVGNGDAVINMTPTPEINYEHPDSFVSVTVRYPIAQLADCQPNGIADTCDLATGTSNDCDGDAMPDECEPDADGDSIPDDCDQPGDFDHDADVDLVDYRLFWVCLLLSGPGEPVPFAECREAFDADVDGDIDLRDVADFARRLSL